MNHLAYATSVATSVVAMAIAATPAAAQSAAPAPQSSSAGQSPVDASDPNDIVVTATRREERIQDVPLSITAYSQAELTRKGMVGYEELSRQTPGVVLNQASANNSRLTARGISTNGWGAGLQTTTTTYLDELPLTTVGNTVTLNPALYDIERVEFLRGPQGTLFGSGSLSGALRILTKSPDTVHFDASAMADIGWTPDGDGIRQRYNGMINVPIVADKIGFRAVGFYRNEDGYIDNVGTGVKNSNKLKDWGGRATLLFQPTDRLSIKLLASYEDSDPKDASLTNPLLGERKRRSTIPDQYTSETQIYNATLKYDFDFAQLISSSSLSKSDILFNVDLANTFGGGVPYYLYDTLASKAFVQETRLVSTTDGPLDWVVGGFYLHRDTDLTGRNKTTQAFLDAKRITGLTNQVFGAFGNNTTSYELAGFGELTWNVTDTFSATGGIRYGTYGATVTTVPGFSTNYFTRALTPTPAVPVAAVITNTASVTTKYPKASKVSWKGSLAYRPTRDLTAYATVSTGYRTPVYNARAGLVSPVDPTDLVIPSGAGSDKLTNYEVGVKGRWLGGKLTANVAVYYIDWSNIQVQANRQSDSVQFATNVGAAVSKGLEAEITVTPVRGLTFGLNGSLNDAKVTDLTASEAAISGAREGSRLASPHVQGSFFGTYSYKLGGDARGFTAFQIQHVGSFPNGFPYTPGKPTVPNPLHGFTDSYTYINLQSGITINKLNLTLYVENLTNSDAVTYIHPENFIDSRYAILRPRTFGIRIGYNL